MKSFIRRIESREDGEFLYRILQEHGEAPGARCYDQNAFDRWLSQMLREFYHSFYLICEQETGRYLGCVFSYDYNMNNGHCRIKAVADTDDISDALAQFLHRLFRDFPIRRITAMTEQSCTGLISLYERVGFSMEVRLIAYRYLHGRYEDVMILGLGREDLIRKELGDE